MRRWILWLPLLAACGNDQSTTSQLVPGHDAPGPDAPVVLPARPDAPPAPQPDAAPSPVYRGIFARGSSLWVVGDRGTILHHDDGIWRAEPSGTAADLLAIAGDDQDIWVVGKDGTVLQSGGTGVWYQPVGHLSGEWLLSVAVADGVAFIGGVEVKATVRGRGLEVNLLFDNSYEYSAISGTHDGDMWLAANWIENTTMPTGVLFHGGTAGWTEVAGPASPAFPTSTSTLSSLKTAG